MEDDIMSEDEEAKSEDLLEEIKSIKSEEEQKNFNNNLINSLKSEEVKNSLFNIFDSYYQSEKTNHNTANVVLVPP